MKRILFLYLLLAASITATAQKVKVLNANFGIIYPFSTNGVHAPNDTNHLSLHLISGVSAKETGFALSGITNVILQEASGMELAGFSNHVKGHVQGMQLAGFLNTAGSVNGVQVAGFSNITKQESGIQVSGFFNHATDAMVQTAGFLNMGRDICAVQAAGFGNVGRDVNATQAAGFFNLGRNVNGVQAAGFVNIGKNINGAQAAGFCNVATDVNGAQVAGFVNKARKVKGAQVAGFINVADSSDYPIALVNIIKNGTQSIGITVDESATTLVAFRSGGKYLYGILGAGYNFQETSDLYAGEAGLGAHLFTIKHFQLNAETVLTSLTDFKNGAYLRSSIRILPTLHFADRFDLFGGVSFNHVYTTLHKDDVPKTDYIWSDQESGHFNGLYIGGIVGIQCRINR
ncbi:hypothetical protein [Taibaiella soli]|uniref:Porin n=1 Tax=Taibaiella soli TaxID=1649169 RepID=A0A2W2BKM9_9BACT|nr:hypothetical protein [Taibaiella soli]PZF74026.1 hypothetical protein DN068_04840 [Taibaiella soli]